MDLEKITSQVNEAITQLELKKGIYLHLSIKCHKGIN